MPDSHTNIIWTVSDLLTATGGEMLQGSREQSFSDISIDSRIINKTDFFVAIKGQNYDGFSFAHSVIGNGVKGLLIHHSSKNLLPEVCAGDDTIVCIAVTDTTRGLGDLANFHLKRSNIPVIAITGSNGKTTTKEMTAAIINRRHPVLYTTGNLNNEIGLPLTLLRIRSEHAYVVVEMGMNHPGEIRRLARIADPQYGLITNIGHAHLEGVGSIEGVMHAKGEILEELGRNATAILNADDPFCDALSKKTGCKKILFGISEKSDIRAFAIKQTPDGTKFKIQLPSGSIDVGLNIPGIFMVSNALAAATVGHLIGLTAEDIKSGLESFRAVNGRLNILKTGNGISIIDDTYNANPGSMEAAINTFSIVRKGKKGFLVIGDMMELGNHAETLHQKIGGIAADTNINKLYVTGKYADSVAVGAKKQNSSIDVFTGSLSEIIEDMTKILDNGDWVLVKGSRSMGMEQAIKDLQEWGNC
ncbi:MAG: UDP-N-acetylmuramoyl-tripeptide--D-alanyl-D-alanine ligase [Desulfobacterales bacterium]|nr:UDP-N-acetylmuramoyl-tripeptide--D-alanyl-D-alanine ligase [Desulfobacterales bacterium]